MEESNNVTCVKIAGNLAVLVYGVEGREPQAGGWGNGIAGRGESS